MSDLGPGEDEIEISLFGPGYGECILIHPGNGQWIVVDSCIDLVSKEPIALRYFSHLGVDPAQAVRLVVATHWDDDHVRGLGQLFQTCTSAEFVCSEALNSDHFLEIVYAQTTRAVSLNESGVDEFRKILDELVRRANALGHRLNPPVFAVAERCLWQNPATTSGTSCTITALTPSDASLMASMADIARLLPQLRDAKRGVWPSGKNHWSVVLWITAGDKVALLGADLENTNNPQTGWQAVVDSRRRPSGQASVFKVPHHGSTTGYNVKVWTEMLGEKPVAILSPFRRGKVKLPNTSGIEKICEHTSEGFITNIIPPRDRITRREAAIEKTLRELGLTPTRVNTDIGHIRLRAKQGEDWNVVLSEHARALCAG